MILRERPPLRHTVEVQTPAGRTHRWAPDAPAAEDVPSGLRWSSVMPGGFETLDCTLTRDPARPAPDLDRFSTVIVRDSAMQTVGEYRLESAPGTSGDRLAIAPAAVGWQAHLDDDKSHQDIYVSRDLAAFRGPSSARKIAFSDSTIRHFDHGVEPDDSTGMPTLNMTFTADGGFTPVSEAWFDAGPDGARTVYYDYRADKLGVPPGGAFNAYLRAYVADDGTGSAESTADLLGANGADHAGYHTFAAAYRYLLLRFEYDSTTANNPATQRRIGWRNVAVYGDQGLPLYGDDPGGVVGSDVLPHALAKWAPFLRFTSGPDGTIAPSSFVIPHLAFVDRGAVSRVVQEVSRFELQDWAVWEDRMFFWHPRGARGRSWRARVGPAGLEETGRQADRVWESIIVVYQDVGGASRTVGPPGSGADTESDDLVDADPENPANRLGLPRRDLLQVGTSTAAVAIELGRRFLEQAKLLDSSGRARLSGHVEDDRGVLHPYSHVRGGDTIAFVDAGDTSSRRIVRADCTHDDRAVAIDLDAPPEGLQALLEQLGAVLIPLGLN